LFHMILKNSMKVKFQKGCCLSGGKLDARYDGLAVARLLEPEADPQISLKTPKKPFYRLIRCSLIQLQSR
jgi:hypothetical protein